MADLFVVEMNDSVSYIYDSKTLKLYKVPTTDFIEQAGSDLSTFENAYIGYGGRVYLDSTTHHITQGKYGSHGELYVYGDKKFTLGGRYHTLTVLERMTFDASIVNDISVDGEVLSCDFSNGVAWKDVIWLCYVVQYKNYYLFYYKFGDCRFILVFNKYSLLYVIGENASYIGGIQKEFAKAKLSGLVDLFYNFKGVVTDDVLHFEL